MIKRPKNTDTMDDVLEMQRNYIDKKDKDFAPAAQVVSKTNKSEKKSSIFAQKRNLKEKPIDKSDRPVFVIKDIIERKYDPLDLSATTQHTISSKFMETDSGFPDVININYDDHADLKKESLFASIMKRKSNEDAHISDCKEDEIKMEADLTNSELLKNMTTQEILEERERLLNTMDPSLVKFLLDRKKAGTSNSDQNEKVKAESSTKSEKHFEKYVADLTTNEILQEASAFNYVNMDIVEPEKLEWLKNVQQTHSIPKDKKYEARFDLKGFLLPYTLSDEAQQDDKRELYCHEEESHRPGYTLQELFRLARAEVLQQRVSAISAITGIINIYMQGFYDGIIDLPMSKIFFFLRFALDENLPIIIETTIKGLAYLFYNEVDETVLDMIFETNLGFLQPLMSGDYHQNQEVMENNDFQRLNINEQRENLFESKIDDILSSDERDKESMTDFHLAEIDLIECLERTNIIERISYIMTVIKPNQNTNISCLKILIRLARSSNLFAEKIIRKSNLIKHLLSKDLLSFEKPEESKMIIKLFRILASFNYSNMSKLIELSLLDILITFISIQNDMNIKNIHLQIECFRFLRLYFKTNPDESNFNRILFPIRYLLEWHLHHLDFHERNHFMCRIHACSLIYLIQCSNVHVTYSLFGETFKMCCKKWYQRAAIRTIQDFSQKILLACLLDVAGSFIKYIPEFFYDFIEEYLIKFLKSGSFKELVESLMKTSLLINNFSDRRFSHKALLNLGSIIRRSSLDSPKLIYSQEYPAFYISSLLNFISLFKDERNDMSGKIYKMLNDLFFSEEIGKYLEIISTASCKMPTIATNWFVQAETKLIYNLLKMKFYHDPWIVKAAFNLIQYLTHDKFLLILDIFDSFIFNEEYSGSVITKEELDRMKYIYNGLVMSKIKDQKNHIAVIERWNENLLKDTWVYELLLIFLNNVGVNSSEIKQIIEIDLSEEEIITTTLRLKCWLNTQQIVVSSLDEQLMYLMLIYFGQELSFLNESVKAMISQELETLKGQHFKFNTRLNNERDFESLYKLFLETFQARSYADNIFSSIVMIPLSQKYDAKWRKIVWSEYAMILKFITCDENDLIYDFNDYLFPIETDQSLLKSYRSSLNHLKKDSVPWKIATHHVSHTKY